MKYRFHTTSEKAWGAMLHDLKQAQRSIYWEVHALHDDTPEHDFIDVLKAKAREGISVRIIVDVLGSFGLSNQSRRELEEAGVEVLTFRYVLHRTHRKILIIDERVGYLGGVNVGSRYRGWIDLHVRLQGSIAKKLLRTFSRTYKMCRGRDSHILKIYHERKFTRAKYKFRSARHWIVDHTPVLKNRKRLRQYYERRIKRAREHLVFVTPYFAPHKWFIRAIKEARGRGVSVDVIIPRKTDIGILGIANYLFAHRLKKHGVTFYLTHDMLHAKALLIDNEEGLIGSNNIDAQSFDLNTETSVVFQRKDMIRDLRRIIERWKRGATPFHAIKHQVRWYHKPLELVVDVFHPLL